MQYLHGRRQMFEAAAFVGQRMPITLLKESPAMGARAVATAVADAATDAFADAAAEVDNEVTQPDSESAPADYEEGVPPAALAFDV